jgi:hypothetical protein
VLLTVSAFAQNPVAGPVKPFQLFIGAYAAGKVEGAYINGFRLDPVYGQVFYVLKHQFLFIDAARVQG